MGVARPRKQIHSPHGSPREDPTTPRDPTGRPRPGRGHRGALHGRAPALPGDDAVQGPLLQQLPRRLGPEAHPHPDPPALHRGVPATARLEGSLEGPRRHDVASDLPRLRDVHVPVPVRLRLGRGGPVRLRLRAVVLPIADCSLQLRQQRRLVQAVLADLVHSLEV